MPHDALVLHQLPGRIRLQVAALKHDSQGLGRFAEALRECPRVTLVDATPRLGTLLVCHQGGWQEVLEWARARALFRVDQPPTASIHDRLQTGIDGVGRGLSTVCGSRLEPREWITLGLIGLALHQALEGNLMAPAVTLLWYAFNNAQASAADRPYAPPVAGQGTGAPNPAAISPMPSGVPGGPE